MNIDLNKLRYTNTNPMSVFYSKDCSMFEFLSMFNYNIKNCDFARIGVTTIYVSHEHTPESFYINNVPEDISENIIKSELSKYVRDYKINILLK